MREPRWCSATPTGAAMSRARAPLRTAVKRLGRRTRFRPDCLSTSSSQARAAETRRWRFTPGCATSERPCSRASDSSRSIGLSPPSTGAWIRAGSRACQSRPLGTSSWRRAARSPLATSGCTRHSDLLGGTTSVGGLRQRWRRAALSARSRLDHGAREQDERPNAPPARRRHRLRRRSRGLRRGADSGPPRPRDAAAADISRDAVARPRPLPQPDGGDPPAHHRRLPLPGRLGG